MRDSGRRAPPARCCRQRRPVPARPAAGYPATGRPPGSAPANRPPQPASHGGHAAPTAPARLRSGPTGRADAATPSNPARRKTPRTSPPLRARAPGPVTDGIRAALPACLRSSCDKPGECRACRSYQCAGWFTARRSSSGGRNDAPATHPFPGPGASSVAPAVRHGSIRPCSPDRDGRRPAVRR